MHSCPRCGMECDCNGDWDDIAVMNDDWVFKNCECECEQMNQEDGYDDDENDYEDEDYFDERAVESPERHQENKG